MLPPPLFTLRLEHFAGESLFGHGPKLSSGQRNRRFYGQGPSVSPCARWAGTACWSTMVVTDGLVADSVRFDVRAQRYLPHDGPRKPIRPAP